MDKLNWAFSLYAVVLGLTLTEVLTGLAKSIRRRHFISVQGDTDGRLGVLTPLLAIWIMFDISSFWLVAWTLQDAISVDPLTLSFGLLVSSLYYVAGSWVFPDDDVARGSLDDHYFRQKSFVFGLVLASNLLTFLGRSWISGAFKIPGFELYDYATLALYFLLQLAGVLLGERWSNGAVLVCLLLLTIDFNFGIGIRMMNAIS